MTPAEAIRTLLQQHEQLESKLGELWIMARESADGLKVPELRQGVEALVAAFSEHEANEDRLLEPLLKRRKAQGLKPPDYLAVHKQEVRALLRSAVQQLDSGQSEIERARGILKLISQLRAHTRREEREFVAELTGRQQHYVTDGFGG